MEQAVKRVKVCAYCRVSTKEDEQLDSYNNQIRFFEREFGERAGYELVEIYRDRGTSGTKLSRPGFDKMILDAGIDKRHIDGDLYRIIDKPKFNRILVKNASRFARNVSADMLLKTLKKNGVFVDFVSSGVSTENNDENIIVNIYLAIAEGESREKSERVRFGIKEGIKRGSTKPVQPLFRFFHAAEFSRVIKKICCADFLSHTHSLLYCVILFYSPKCRK